MSQQAATMNQPQRVPLVVTADNRSESLSKDAKLVNCFVEKDVISGDYNVIKRQGVGIAAQYSGAGQGAYNWLGDVYAIYGGQLLKNGFSIGSVDSTNGMYFFEPLRSVPALLVFGNAVKTYYTNGTTVTQITGDQLTFAGYFVVGNKYVIATIGTTDFTLIGASANTVGIVFTATGNGVGTGTAALQAGYLTVGGVYTIRTLGSTNFTSVGAASNIVGTVFTATGVGTGTGTVYQHNFPASVVKGFAYLDGTMYVMTPDAEIKGTATLPSLDQVTYWDPLNSITARIETDPGVCLAKHLVYVIALKKWTSEAFYDAGNATGSPLSPVQGAKSPYGCVSADSVQNVDDNLLWLASNQKVSPQIVMMTDLKVRVISTPPIERILDQADRSSMYSWILKHEGHRFYALTLLLSNITLVYDMDQEIWSYYTDANGNYWPYCAVTYDANNQHLIQHASNGGLYYIENCFEYSSDDGTLIPVDIYTPRASFSIDKRKTLNLMRFEGDIVPGSLVYTRHTDDDYLNWSNFRMVNMGQARPILTNCGTFYTRAWHIRHYANTPFRIKYISLQMDIGTL